MEVAEKVVFGKKLSVPENCPQKITELMERCWLRDPQQRPNFHQIFVLLNQIAKEKVKKKFGSK